MSRPNRWVRRSSSSPVMAQFPSSIWAILERDSPTWWATSSWVIRHASRAARSRCPSSFWLIGIYPSLRPRYLIGIDQRVQGLLQRRPYLIFNAQPLHQRLGFGVHAQRENQSRQRPSQLCLSKHRFALELQHIVRFEV